MSEATEQLRKHVHCAAYTTSHRENALDVCDEAERDSSIFSELLALLDRIELEKDYKLSSQRFDIAEKHGLKVVFGEPTSGRIN